MSDKNLKTNPQTTKLNRAEVHRIVGEIDDIKTAEIIGSGASVAELEEAAAHVRGQSTIGGRQLGAPAGRIATLYDILTADPGPDQD